MRCIRARPIERSENGSPHWFGASGRRDWTPRGFGRSSICGPWGSFLVAVVTGLATGLWRRNRVVFVTALALCVLTLAMSLTSRRFVPLFAMSQALLLGPVIAALVPPLPRALRLALPVTALAFGLLLLWPYPKRSYAFHYMTDEDSFPVELCDFIAANHLEGRVFAYYNWGGYLHFRTRGAMKVYIDGRGDMVFDNDTYRRYVMVLQRQSGWRPFVEATGAQFVLWPRTQPQLIQELLGSGHWRLVYQDAVGALLVATDQPAPALAHETVESPWKELARGALASAQGQHAEAETHYRRALEKIPYLQLANYGVAEAQAQQGRYAEAASQIERCQRIFPNRGRRERFEAYVERLRRAR